MAKHIHAELMAEFAKDAMETEFPNLRWEYKTKEATKWTPMTAIPMWDINVMYRKKPTTISVNGFEVPQGITTMPKGTNYFIYYPDFGLDGLVNTINPDTVYQAILKAIIKRGICYLNSQDALMRAKAMLGLDPLRIEE